jgi:anti-sigma-K factor RskA
VIERSHEEVRSLIAPYVLGAVTAEEEALIRAHLLSCEECLAEADTHSAVTASLAYDVDPVPLPSGFSDRVIEQARGARPAAAPAAKRTWWLRPASVLTGLAAVILVISLGAALVDARSDLSLEREVTAALLDERGMRMEGAGAAAAKVPADGKSVFVAEDLPAPPEDNVYQVWLIEESGPTSFGVFEPEDGRALLEGARPLTGVTAVAVTVEPEGGSEQPTSDPIVSSS